MGQDLRISQKVSSPYSHYQYSTFKLKFDQWTLEVGHICLTMGEDKLNMLNEAEKYSHHNLVHSVSAMG